MQRNRPHLVDAKKSKVYIHEKCEQKWQLVSEKRLQYTPAFKIIGNTEFPFNYRKFHHRGIFFFLFIHYYIFHQCTTLQTQTIIIQYCIKLSYTYFPICNTKKGNKNLLELIFSYIHIYCLSDSKIIVQRIFQMPANKL